MAASLVITSMLRRDEGPLRLRVDCLQDRAAAGVEVSVAVVASRDGVCGEPAELRAAVVQVAAPLPLSGQRYNQQSRSPA